MGANTDTITIRLRNEQIAALKKLPNSMTASSLLRGLVTLYLRGLIPHSWVVQNSTTTTSTTKST